MNILFIGDIFASPGRSIVAHHLAEIVAEEKIDLAIANAENSAGGFGITPMIAEELFGLGLDILTSGNHVFDKREIYDYLPRQPRLLRPANYPEELPGFGLVTMRARNGVEVAVMNLQGRVYMPQIDCPFHKADQLLASISTEIKVRFVDFHAERVAAPLAEDLDHQLAEAVDDLWMPLKVRRGVDHPQHFQNPIDAIETAELGLQRRQDRQPHLPGRVPPLLFSQVIADFAANHRAVRQVRAMAGDVDDVPGLYNGVIDPGRFGSRRKLQLQLIKTGIRIHDGDLCNADDDSPSHLPITGRTNRLRPLRIPRFDDQLQSADRGPPNSEAPGLVDCRNTRLYNGFGLQIGAPSGLFP